MSAIYTARRIVWSSKSLMPMALAMIAAGFDFYVPVSAFFLESRGFWSLVFWWLKFLPGLLATVSTAGDS